MIDYSTGIYLILHGQQLAEGVDREALQEHMKKRFESLDRNRQYYVESVIKLFEEGSS